MAKKFDLSAGQKPSSSRSSRAEGKKSALRRSFKGRRPDNYLPVQWPAEFLKSVRDKLPRRSANSSSPGALRILLPGKWRSRSVWDSIPCNLEGRGVVEA
ncbi:hypothetical protein KM043_007881 [Ampulex compressa]|nr:hypothetical protein KM043_007881 [Ampulex compressa]